MTPLNEDVAPKNSVNTIEDYDRTDYMRLQKENIRDFLIKINGFLSISIEAVDDFVHNFTEKYAENYLYDCSISFGKIRKKLNQLESAMKKIEVILQGKPDPYKNLADSIGSFEIDHCDVLIEGFTGTYGDIYVYKRYHYRVLEIIRIMTSMKASEGKEIRVISALLDFSKFYVQSTGRKFHINKDETKGKTVKEQKHKTFKGADVQLFTDLIKILEPGLRSAQISSALTSFSRLGSGIIATKSDVICPE